MKKYIKHRLLQWLRPLLKEMEEENIISSPSKCEIAPSVKLRGTHINGTVKIGSSSVLEKATISGTVNLGENVHVSSSVISGHINIGDHSKIIDGAGLHGNIEIGRNTSINGPNTDLRSAIHKIVIGNFCSIARNVTFQEYYHDHHRLTTYMVKKHLEKKTYLEDIVSKGTIEIGHDVWIGTQCVVLSGAKIGTGAVVAANSVVTGEIPPYAIVAGSPAKVIKYRFDETVIASLIQSEWWLKPHVEIIEYFNSFSAKH